MLAQARQSGPDRSGDYMEFGVFKGYAFWHAQRIARELRLDSMLFFGFNSFAGLPAPQGVDATPDETFYQGQYACAARGRLRRQTSAATSWRLPMAASLILATARALP